MDGEPEVVVRDEEAVAARLQCEVLGERLRGVVVRLEGSTKCSISFEMFPTG